MYGFEGDPGREGEVFTRIIESTYRRYAVTATQTIIRTMPHEEYSVG